MKFRALAAPKSIIRPCWRGGCALDYWASIQPVRGAAASVLLLGTLRRRRQGVAAADFELVKV